MQHLADLFKLAEITRDQVQYGYNLAGIRKNDLSDLAQHQYLVSFMGWQLGRLYNKSNGGSSIERIIEICMIYDFGELMGGDINSFYAKTRPKSRELAKSFEAENNKFISNFFGNDRDYYRELIKEMTELKTDESLLAKVADYVEVLCYKHRLNVLLVEDQKFANKIIEIANRLSNKKARTVIIDFLNSWKATLKNDYQGIVNILHEKSS